jgi:hypothetical protein
MARGFSGAQASRHPLFDNQSAGATRRMHIASRSQRPRNALIVLQGFSAQNPQPCKFQYSPPLKTHCHKEIAGKIWEIANRLRGPYRPPQYRLVMLPMVVLRRLD